MLIKTTTGVSERDKNSQQTKTYPNNKIKKRKKKSTPDSMATTEESVTENDPPGKIRRQKTFTSPGASTYCRTRTEIDWNTEYEKGNQPLNKIPQDTTINPRRHRNCNEHRLKHR